MNKTININLAGIIFHVDEEAYQILTEYLNKLKAKLSRQEGSDEILMDVESRIAELFNERLDGQRQVVDMTDVNAVVEIMGQPEDYADSEEEEAAESSYQGDSTREFTGPKRLYRDPDDNILGGVCSGLGAYLNIDTVWIRLLFVALILLGSTGFWLYIILWIVIPEAKTTAQKLQMRGEKINLSNIERSVKEELRGVGKTMSDLGKDRKIRKGGNRIAQSIEDVVSAILAILTSILKVAFKIIGIALLFGGVVMIVVVMSAFIGYGVDINGNTIGIDALYTYGTALFPEGYGPNYLWTAIALTAVGPVFGLVALGARILFNYKAHNKAIVALASLSTLSGFVMFLVLGFATSAEFRTDDRSRMTFAVVDASPDEALIVKTSKQDYYTPYETNWYVSEGKIVIEDVEFDVLKTSESEPYIEISLGSNGKSRSQAAQLIEDIDFSIVQNGNEIIIDQFLTTPLGNKYRDQEVNVVLYLPEGYSVYLDHSSKDIIYDIDNVTNTYDAYMVDHVWYMTTQGLACADCENSVRRENINSNDFEEKWLEEAKQMELQLEKAPSAPNIKTNDSRQELPQAGIQVSQLSLSPIIHSAYIDQTILI